MQHVIGNAAADKGAIERKDFENKNRMLKKVIGLIGELKNSLDMEKAVKFLKIFITYTLI